MLLSVLGWLLPLQACFVTSVNPLFTDSDSVFDRNLIGTWKVDDGDGQVTFLRQEDDYRVVYVADGVARAYDAKLVEIVKVRYLDVSPTPGEAKQVEAHFRPVHSIWRLTLEGNSLKLVSMNEDFIKQQLQDRSSEIAGRLIDSDVLLTSPTNDLQEFVRSNPDKLFPAENSTTWRRQ
jgi:hypothetical protein